MHIKVEHNCFCRSLTIETFYFSYLYFNSKVVSNCFLLNDQSDKANNLLFKNEV